MSELPADSAFLNYLLLTEKRPGMYFGSYKVDHVRRHLDGWRAHRRMFEDQDEFADYFFEHFRSFVEQHYKDNRTIGWNGLIRENTSTDEEGFRKFVALLKRFASGFATKAS